MRQSALLILAGIFFSLSPSLLYAQDEIRDFSSDGCSLFPDRSLITGKDWCSCCFAHDIAYWKGGTEQERLRADQTFRDCVQQKTGNREFAELTFQGVRFGGSPYFYNWYRWGYGWSYARKYQALNQAEQQMVAQKLQQYFADSPPGICQ